MQKESQKRKKPNRPVKVNKNQHQTRGSDSRRKESRMQKNQEPPTLPPQSRPGDAYVQSFARGLAVIRSFDATRPSQTLSEVAEASGLTRAGARRIGHIRPHRHRDERSAKPVSLVEDHTSCVVRGQRSRRAVAVRGLREW